MSGREAQIGDATDPLDPWGRLEQRFLDAEPDREWESAPALAARYPMRNPAQMQDAAPSLPENVFIVNKHGSGVVLQNQDSQVRLRTLS